MAEIVTPKRITHGQLGIVDNNWKDRYPPPTLVKNNMFAKMVRDPETGFLASMHTANGQAEMYFTIPKKKAFVALAKKLYPNMSAVCKEVGISVQTYKNHYQVDEAFHNAIEEIKEAAIDKIESHMFLYAGNKQNFMDRIAIMRAYRGEIYNPKSTVTFKHEISPDEASRRRVALAEVVDADVISASQEVLESEVSLSVPGPSAAAAEPVQSPSGGYNVEDTHAVGGMVPESRSRDPLAILLEKQDKILGS